MQIIYRMARLLHSVDTVKPTGESNDKYIYIFQTVKSSRRGATQSDLKSAQTAQANKLSTKEKNNLDHLLIAAFDFLSS